MYEDARVSQTWCMDVLLKGVQMFKRYGFSKEWCMDVYLKTVRVF